MLCAELSLCGFSVVGVFVDYSGNAYSNITMELVFQFVPVCSLGCAFCLIFGLPFLFLIDKYVKIFWPKYIFAAGVLSLGAWFVLSWAAFSLRLLFHPSD